MTLLSGSGGTGLTLPLCQCGKPMRSIQEQDLQLCWKCFLLLEASQ